MEVLKCLECGEVLQQNDPQCSYCKTLHPLGVKCLVCLETLKESEAIKYENDKTGLVKYFHPECYQQFNKNYSRGSQMKQPLILEPLHNYHQHQKKSYFSESDFVEANFNQKLSLRKIQSEVMWKRLSKFITVFLLSSFLLGLWGFFFYMMMGDLGIIVGLLTTMFMMVPIVKGL